MASGHVNRIKRPNTWLHRPMLQNVKKALANTEPSTHGTFRKWQLSWRMSVHRRKADSYCPGCTGLRTCPMRHLIFDFAAE